MVLMNELERHLARNKRPYSYGHQQMYNGPIELLKGKKWDVLDVGAGIGYGYLQMERAGILREYTGLEPDYRTFRHLESQRQYPTHTFRNEDFLFWVGGGVRSHEWVFCIEVIEHVEPATVPTFLEKLRGVTKRGLFLSTPDSQRHKHGVRTDGEWQDLLSAAGFRTVALTPQWTTLHVCVPI